jgi:hydrogenase maturation protease
MAPEGSRTLVLGLGNPDRRDDGCGREAARRLRERLGRRAEVCEIRGEPTAILERWAGRGRVIVIDAVRSGRPGGTVRRIAVSDRTAPATVGGTSTHGLSLGETIALGRALGRMPEALVIYGIEVGDLAPGEGLTPPVAAAVKEVVERVDAEVARGAGEAADA